MTTAGASAAGPAQPRRLPRPRRLASTALLTVTFLPLAVAYLWQVDVSPLTVGGLLADRVLQTATVLSLPGLVAVAFGPPRFAMLASALISFVGLALAATVLVAGLRPPRDLLALAAAGACLIGCAVNSFLILPGRVLARRHATKAVAATAIGLVLPALQFWHTTSFVPANVATNLSVDPSFESGELVDGQVRGVATLQVRNVGEVRSVVILSDLKLCARRQPAPLPERIEKLLADPECQTFEPIGRRSWIDAQATLTRRIAVLIPQDRPFVQLVARVAHARGDRVRELPDSEQDRRRFGGCDDAQLVELQEETAYKALAQHTKYLVYASRPSGEPSYSFTTEEEAECPRESLQLGAYFGATQTKVISDGWVVVKLSPQGADG